MIFRSKPSAMLALSASRIPAIEGVDVEQLAVVGDVDAQRSRRQRDEVGEQRDLEIARHRQREGDDRRAEIGAHVGPQRQIATLTALSISSRRNKQAKRCHADDATDPASRTEAVAQER